MAVTTSIMNFKNPNDKERQIKGYFSYLNSQSQLNARIANKMKTQRDNKLLGITPTPNLRNVQEELQDLTYQREIALSNLREIMPRDALDAMRYLPDIDDLILFNRHFSDFKNKMGKQKFMTPQLFSTLWERYQEYLASTNNTGIDIPLTNTALRDTLRGMAERISQSIISSHQATKKEISELNEFLDNAVANGNTEILTKLDNLSKRTDLNFVNFMRSIRSTIQYQTQKILNMIYAKTPEELLEPQYSKRELIDVINEAVSQGNKQVIDDIYNHIENGIKIDLGNIIRNIDDIKEKIDTMDEQHKRIIEKLFKAMKSGNEENTMKIIDEISKGNEGVKARLIGAVRAGNTVVIEQIINLAEGIQTDISDSIIISTLNGMTVQELKAVAKEILNEGVVIDNLIRTDTELAHALGFQRMAQLTKRVLIGFLRDHENDTIRILNIDVERTGGGLQRKTNVHKIKSVIDKRHIALRQLKKGYGLYAPSEKTLTYKGIIAPKEERYLPFGKFWLHMPSLKKSKLNIKYPSYACIPELPSTPISKELKDFVYDLVDNHRINFKAYHNLKDVDRRIFSKYARRANLDDYLGLDDDDDEQQEREQLLKRYQILTGEIQAGNDAPEIKKELKMILSRFISNGTVSRKDGIQMLIELSI